MEPRAALLERAERAGQVPLLGVDFGGQLSALRVPRWWQQKVVEAGRSSESPVLRLLETRCASFRFEITSKCRFLL